MNCSLPISWMEVRCTFYRVNTKKTSTYIIASTHVSAFYSSRGLTLLNIGYLLIIVLAVLLCRYVYSVLPPGDEDLKGSEVQAIIKFKRALGLDDVDAANMHMEVWTPDPNPFISYHLSHMFLFFSFHFPCSCFKTFSSLLVLDW